jgi:hypothetical protein
MPPIIHFKCRACEAEAQIYPSRAERVSCPRCSADLNLAVDDSILDRNIVTKCASCGHDTLYLQKDFNRQAGMAIVSLGIVISIYFFARNQPLYAMSALALTAMVDFLAYFLVGEVTVCYSCHAIYRGFKRNPEHEPFDLKKLEKYGGRTPRF